MENMMEISMRYHADMMEISQPMVEYNKHLYVFYNRVMDVDNI